MNLLLLRILPLPLALVIDAVFEGGLTLRSVAGNLQTVVPLHI